MVMYSPICWGDTNVAAKDRIDRITTNLAPVVEKVDSAIHRMNWYPVVGAIGFPNYYPLDSDLSDG